MGVKSLILATAALAATAYADPGCTFTATATITEAASVQTLAACTAISGDIVFGQGAADAGNLLSLPNVKEFDGSITYQNDAILKTFSAPALTSITGLTFSNLSSLSSTSFPKLEKANTISFAGCASLTDLGMPSIGDTLGSLSIINTVLANVNTFSNVGSFQSVEITGNRNLNDITLNANMVGANLTLNANNALNGLYAVNMANLTYANAINVQNASSISIPILAGVADDFFLYGNTFQTFSAPNLTYCGGLYLHSNPKLANLSLPALTMINGSQGAFDIANNTALTSIGGFPLLSKVANNVNFYGGFTNVSTGSLTQTNAVNGAFNVYSSQSLDDACNAINALKANNTIKGAETCKGLSNAAGTTNGNGSTNTNGGSPSSTSSSPAMAMTIPSLTLGTGVFAGLLQFLLSL